MEISSNVCILGYSGTIDFEFLVFLIHVYFISDAENNSLGQPCIQAEFPVPSMYPAAAFQITNLET